MAETQETPSTKTPVAEAESSLIEQMLESIDIRPQEEAYSPARRGLEEIVRALLVPERKDMKVNQAMVVDMIAEMDRKLSAQVDAILHHATFQKLESAWRGLKLAVERTEFRENIQFEILNVSKEELLTDFLEAPDVTKSSLYKHLYTAEFGQFGGNPIGAMVANYEFGPGPQDVKLLQYVASVATMAHAPFLAAAGPKFFGMESFLRLPNLRDLKTHFEGPQYIKWNAFRDSEDARSVGLCLPRFLLRLPYSQEANPAKVFNYTESLSNGHESYLWGNTAFAFATRLTDSFAKSRWYTNIIGPISGGTVENLPVHLFESMGGIETKIPTNPDFRRAREGIGRCGLHRLDHAEGLGQRLLFFRQLLPTCQDFRPECGGQGGGGELSIGHSVALPLHRQPVGPLPQGAANRTTRQHEGPGGSGTGTQYLDQPVRVRAGCRHGGSAASASTPGCSGDGQRCGGKSRLVSGRSESGAAHQIYGRLFHVVPGRSAR